MADLLDSIEEFDVMLFEMGDHAAQCDYTSVLADWTEKVAEHERDSFDAEQEPGGTPWLPLAPSTVKRKGFSTILFEDGVLQTSLTEIGGPGNIYSVDAHDMIFGTSVPYATFHETGTSRMPARPAVGVNDELVDQLCEQIADYVVQEMMR